MARDLGSIESDIVELKKLLSSRGWAILSGSVEADILCAARDLARNPNMPDTEMHFRRGAIFASDNFNTLPLALLQQLEGEYLVQSNLAATNGDIHATT